MPNNLESIHGTNLTRWPGKDAKIYTNKVLTGTYGPKKKKGKYGTMSLRASKFTRSPQFSYNQSLSPQRPDSRSKVTIWKQNIFNFFGYLRVCF